MGLGKKLILWFTFLSSFGFAGGIYFLLFLIVPFEEILVNKELSQMEIDNIISYVVYGWVVFGFIISFIYFGKILNKNRAFIAYFLVIVTVIGAILALYMFLNTDTALVSGVRAEEQEVNERFTFGPYPDIERMQSLKEEGYDGIVTLLSTTLEKELLDTELTNGELVGIDVYSFPMLPWIGDNKEAIQGVKNLINSDDYKRYYVHCYLGKHRADIIKQVILTELGQKLETRKYLYPTYFERGELFTFEDKNIILGPYPTDEEWLFLIRNGVKEIISFLPGESSFLEKERMVADEYSLIFTNMPYDSETEKITLDTLNQIKEYINSLDHKVYLHGFYSKGIVSSLELLLKENLEPIQTDVLPSDFAGGVTYNIGKQMILGPKPSLTELNNLKDAGVDTIIYLTNNQDNSGIYELVNYSGLNYQEFYLNNYSLKNLYIMSQEIKTIRSTIYIFSNNSSVVLPLYNMLQGSIYGIDKSLESIILENGNIKFARRRDDILIGPYLENEEWEQVIIANGIEEVIAINVPSLYSREIVESQSELAEEYGVSYTIIDMYEDYEDILLKHLLESEETTYIIVPMQFQEIIYELLRG